MKHPEWLSESGVKEPVNMACLLGTLAINGEVRENELVQDIDTGSRKFVF